MASIYAIITVMRVVSRKSAKKEKILHKEIEKIAKSISEYCMES